MITVLGLPDVAITADTLVCLGDTITLNASGATGYFWSTGETGDQITVSVNDTTTYTLQGYDGSCYNSESIDIYVANPDVYFDLDGTEFYYPHDFELEAESENVDIINWYINDDLVDNDNQLTYDFDIGSYTIVLEGEDQESGCIDTYNYSFEVISSGVVYIPNAFSPNNDGINDEYFIVSEDFETVDVSIFDRWGVLIINWSGAQNTWDGRSVSGDELPIGTYVVMVEGKFFNGDTYKTITTVTLIR